MPEYSPDDFRDRADSLTSLRHDVDDSGLADAIAEALADTANAVPVGVCGSRMTDSTGPWTHHFVCTKTPGHLQAGDRDHTDDTRHGAPAATWTEPEPEPVSYPLLGDPDVIVTHHPVEG